MYDFKDKIAMVTGGAAGIGLACVQTLLLNGVHGVTIADNNEEQGKEAVQKLAEQFGENKVVFVKTDVTKADEFEGAFKTTYKTWNTLDILINNAGVFNDTQWDLEISVNCTSVVRGTLLGFDYIKENKNGKGGIIINVSSVYGLQKAAGAPVYAGTKHFVVGLSRSLGSPFYFGSTKVKVITLCPGVTLTTLFQNVYQNALREGMEQVMQGEFNSLPKQGTEDVGNGLIDVINNGSNGSAWVVEGGKPAYEIDFPDRLTLRKNV